jgi:hypothetical protein
MLSPLQVLLGYSPPTPSADRQLLSFELDVNFNIAALTVIMPWISTTFHKCKPPVSERSAISAFKALYETTLFRRGERGELK